jgi:hypothetical protein
MTQSLIDPLGLLNNPVTVVASSQQELARFENTQVGVCPVCKVQMRQILAAGIPSYVCMEHRICVPRENP